MSVNGTISATFNANDVRAVGLTTGANIPINNTASTVFINGTGGARAQVLFQLNGALSSGAYTLDLFTGSADSYGTALALTSVKAFQLVNTGATSLVMGNAGSNPWNTFLNGTGTITLPAGAWIQAATPDATGWAVGTSTNVNILFTGTGTATFTFALLGTGT